MTHDPLCRLAALDTTLQSWGFMQSECDCELIARVRASEAAKWSAAADLGLRAQLERIRAQVQAMRDESFRERSQNLSRAEISERVGEDTAYANVLALLDGVS